MTILAPRVSIVLPAYNAASTLQEAIESVLNQSLAALEVVVVDDASTDDSAHLIQQLAKQDSRVKTVFLTTNVGVHEARLAGIEHSRAEWIGFLDADDLARPAMFETLLERVEQHQVDIAVCGSRRVRACGKPESDRVRFRHDETVESDIFRRFCAFEFGTGMVWNKLYRRSVVLPQLALHFPWRQAINEDLLFNIGCFYRARSVFLLSEQLHDYRAHRHSVTASIEHARAFVDTYRAFAIAVQLYHDLGETALRQITEMYRLQLSWPRYRMAKLEELADSQPALDEAMAVLLRYYPQALPMLAVRLPIAQTAQQRWISQPLRKGLARARTLFAR